VIDLYAEPDAQHWLPYLEPDGLGFEFLASYEARNGASPDPPPAAEGRVEDGAV
jgi:hypothetical protein